MALKPFDEKHRLQIAAGTTGRLAGHEFERQLTADLNTLSVALDQTSFETTGVHLRAGRPSSALLDYIMSTLKITGLRRIQAFSLGGHATGFGGDKYEGDLGEIKKSKT